MASCYERVLEVAAFEGVRSIAFPVISTGVYGFPVERGAAIAVEAVAAAMLEYLGLE